MADQQPPNKRPGPGTRALGAGASPGSGQLGKDMQARHLQGIAPAVVDAFLSGNKRADLEAGPEETRGLFTPPEKPLPELYSSRSPASLGDFKASLDNAEVKAKFNKLKALAQSAREAPSASAVKAPGESPSRGTGAIDPILAKRQRPPGEVAPKGPHTRPLNAPGNPNNTKLQHLAMRAKAKSADPKSLDKLARTVEATLGEKGALKLRNSIKVLEDKALPGRLTALAESVNRLMPEGSAHYAKLGMEVGKQVVQNNVNPFFAVSMALHEIGGRLGELEKWEEMSNKDRIGNMAMLSSNVAEILGAVTPPPVNYGIQVLGAGMLLMGLATEHSEAVEDLAKVTVGDKGAKVVNAGVNDASNHIANRVKNAWDELSDRLATKATKPRLPPQLQAMVDSEVWKTVKQNPVGARVAEGTENLLFNLARRGEAFSASWDQRLTKLKPRKAKKKPPPS